MTTRARGRRRKEAPRRTPTTDREGAILVGAVGIIVAAFGHASMGVAMVAVAAAVYAVGYWGRHSARRSAAPEQRPSTRVARIARERAARRR